MSRLIFVTQAADPADPVLAATLAKIRALAARVDEVVVVADRVAADALPENVRGRSFAGGGRLGRGARLWATLATELATPTDAVLAHMSPVYAVVAATVARPLRVPVLLWFTQQATAGRMLARAERRVKAILTVDERTVPLDSPKIRAIGHGIDLSELECRDASRAPGNKLLLGLGRYAPVKRWELAIRAAAETGAELRLRGPTLTDDDRRQRPELERLAAELGARVDFGDEVAHSEVPQLLAGADALVDATRGNAADKVVYEAAAACVPPLAASPVFDSLLPPELRFDDVASLVDRIRALPSLDPELPRRLRAKVQAEHSVEHWADAVLEAVRA